jgi:hypothetical protein
MNWGIMDQWLWSDVKKIKLYIDGWRWWSFKTLSVGCKWNGWSWQLSKSLQSAKPIIFLYPPLLPSLLTHSAPSSSLILQFPNSWLLTLFLFYKIKFRFVIQPSHRHPVTSVTPHLELPCCNFHRSLTLPLKSKLICSGCQNTWKHRSKVTLHTHPLLHNVDRSTRSHGTD